MGLPSFFSGESQTVENVGPIAVERIVAKLIPQFANVPAFLYAPLLTWLRSTLGTPPATLRSRLETLAIEHDGEISTAVVWEAVLLSLGDDS